MRKVFMLVLLCLLVGCSQNQELESVGSPLPVSLEVGDERYSMTLGSYSWTKKGPFSSVNSAADAPSPNQLAVNMDSVFIDGDRVVKINTTGRPNLSVYLWNEENIEMEISLAGKQFTVPDQAGRYIYEVFAEWKEGEGSYTIVLEVE